MTDVAHTPTATRSPNQPDVAFGGIRQAIPEVRRNDPPDFRAIHAGPAFTELRRRFRRWVFPMAALFFVWYLTYVLLAAYARDFMGQRVIGSVNVGLLLGLLQFVTTLGITAGYLRFARRRLDPQARLVRAELGADRGAAERGASDT